MLSVTQLFAATIFTSALIFPLMVLATAAFRPEDRSPGQNTTLAVAAFVDNTDPPTSPRWYGYFNLWVATLSLPGCVVVVWMFTTTYVMLRSIGAQQTAEKQLVAAP